MWTRAERLPGCFNPDMGVPPRTRHGRAAGSLNGGLIPRGAGAAGSAPKASSFRPSRSGRHPHPRNKRPRGAQATLELAESPMISKKRGHSVWY